MKTTVRIQLRDTDPRLMCLEVCYNEEQTIPDVYEFTAYEMPKVFDLFKRIGFTVREFKGIRAWVLEYEPGMRADRFDEYLTGTASSAHKIEIDPLIHSAITTVYSAWNEGRENWKFDSLRKAAPEAYALHKHLRDGFGEDEFSVKYWQKVKRALMGIERAKVVLQGLNKADKARALDAMREAFTQLVIADKGQTTYVPVLRPKAVEETGSDTP